MALKIRMRKQGRRNSPFYRLVVIDERSPRDGRYVESVGWYNPVETQEDKTFSIDGERVQHWLSVGAQMSENTSNLVKRAAPEVSKWFQERAIAKRAKNLAKQKARKKEAAKK